MNNKNIEYRTPENKGQILNINLGYTQPVKCEAVEPVAGGYTRLIVEDKDPDKPRAGRNFWQRGTNGALGCLYQIHVNQIQIID